MTNLWRLAVVVALLVGVGNMYLIGMLIQVQSKHVQITESAYSDQTAFDHELVDALRMESESAYHHGPICGGGELGK